MVESSYKVDKITRELFVSLDKARVAAVFSKYSIIDFAEKTALLRKCMQVLDVSNTDEEMSDEDEYIDELEIFTEGSWRFLI
jgi:predicted P-loop ATPase/GTPase